MALTVTAELSSASPQRDVIRAHVAVVAEVHPELPHEPAAVREAVTVDEVTPKSSPRINNDFPHVVATFTPQSLTTGESKLTKLRSVPTTDATVTCACRIAGSKSPDVHETVVAELHDAVMHTLFASCNVLVNSEHPNPSPVSVTDAPPVSGALSIALLPTGVSKLKMLRAVPTDIPAVTVADLNKSPSSFDWHATDVSVVHEAVKHTPR
jgi:hypothetical protein